MVFEADYHVATDSQEERLDAHSYYFLYVWSLDQGSQKFDKLKGHALDPMWLFDNIILIRLIASSVLLFLRLRRVTFVLGKTADILVVTLNFRENR